MRRNPIIGATALLAWGCSQPAAQQQAVENAPAANVTINEAPPAPPNVPANIVEQNRPDPLPEPKGPIDPKSVEAAGQVVQSYGALIEQKRWSEANALWGERTAAAKFQSGLSEAREVHLEIGNLGEPEGAAGSIYVTMPVIFYGDAKNGQPFRRSADVILRRVNDVPGSTEAQRRWHIERIDWKDAA
jgi:hypothetical protein